MKNCKNQSLNNRNDCYRFKLRSDRGMTMAEMLVVVAITIVLAGVAFIAVWNHQRSLEQLERDNMAREIFIAAQNHLSMAMVEGRFRTSTDSDIFGFTENDESGLTNPDSSVNYLIVNSGNAGNDVQNTFELMLPWGSIDETVRGGGSYIIRYKRKTGTILDVFYSTPDNTRFGKTLTSDLYDDVMNLRDVEGKGAAGDADYVAAQDHKADRRNWNGAVLGWYGGANVTAMDGLFKAPKIKVQNAAKLTVTVTDTNKEHKGTDGGIMRLIITGVSSGAKKYFDLPWVSTGAPKNVSFESKDDFDASVSVDTHTVVLDDITTDGMRFSSLFANKPVSTDKSIQGHFIRGEDLTIKAVAFSGTKLSNIAYSNEETTNSLFESIGKTATESSAEYDTAYIGNIRHLENLDSTVSDIGYTEDLTAKDYVTAANAEANGTDAGTRISEEEEDNNSGNGENGGTTGVTPTNLPVDISKAIQTDNLIWYQDNPAGTTDPGDFLTQINPTNPSAVKVYWYPRIEDSSTSDPTAVTTNAGKYRPVRLTEGFAYDGDSHSVSRIVIDHAGNAGLFEELPRRSSVKDLELTDFAVIGAYSTGALAGKATGAKIENVIARNTTTYDLAKGTSTIAYQEVNDITSTGGSTGGLIGLVEASVAGGLSTENSSIQYCAASLIVDGKTRVGGLIGEMTAGTVFGCYSGGHTDQGEYYKHTTTQDNDIVRGDALFNVKSDTSGVAGGLIGAAGNTTISYSYSTCSVSGGDNTAGGFVGTASGTITSCYATGLVSGDFDGDDVVNNVFVGKYDGEQSSLTNNHYFSLTGEVEKKEDGKVTSIEYKKSGFLNEDDEDIAGVITPLDETTDLYDSFVSGKTAWNKGVPYDTVLKEYYDGKYNLKTVDQLSGTKRGAEPATNYYIQRHYGDWPAPEIFFINTPNS